MDAHGTSSSHTLNSHSDVSTATGPNVDTLSDGSNADALHEHTATGVSDFDTEVSNNTAVADNTTHSTTTDGTNVHVLTPASVGAQPLDAGLTTLAADTAYKFYANNASGVTGVNGVVNWSIDLTDTGGG